MANRREELKKQRLDFQKGKTAILSIIDRFTTDEAENAMAGIVRSHLKQAEAKLTGIEKELADLEAAAEYLKKYRFRKDKGFSNWLVASASSTNWTQS